MPRTTACSDTSVLWTKRNNLKAGPAEERHGGQFVIGDVELRHSAPRERADDDADRL
jgi:hypothetical protein